MPLDYSSNLSADPMRQVHQLSRPSVPVLLPTLAKLVLTVFALMIFIPVWQELLAQMLSTQSWYALRLLAIAGIAGIVPLLVLAFRLITRLFKNSKAEST